jgi:hypothetical protein
VQLPQLAAARFPFPHLPLKMQMCLKSKRIPRKKKRWRELLTIKKPKSLNNNRSRIRSMGLGKKMLRLSWSSPLQTLKE